jgi:hypothetical protein
MQPEDARTADARAWLAKTRQDVRRVEIDPALGPLMQRAWTLSEYASRFRYPGAAYDPRMEEGQAALALTREVAEAILTRLPDEVRP